MRIVIFGLTVSSAWGNGHATLWRSLIRALDAAGHEVRFFERDVPYYAQHRDLPVLYGRSQLRLYDAWADIAGEAEAAIADADCAIVTSYCPDGRAASAAVLDATRATRVFYDLDTPVTLARLSAGQDVPYLPVDGLADFDLVLSFTGGRALDALEHRLGARRVAPLYGSVDPDQHKPADPHPQWSAACSYLGTWSHDRHAALDALFLEPARRQQGATFMLAGSLYPDEVVFPSNVIRHDHVPPPAHSAFYCSSPITINVTRGPMAELGYCPSGRLFEAAACGVPVLSDTWQGLDTFFVIGEEILTASSTAEALAALQLPRSALATIGKRARDRALAEHSGSRRAAELIAHIEGAAP
jgi:spore maturation protein CgeB